MGKVRTFGELQIGDTLYMTRSESFMIKELHITSIDKKNRKIWVNYYNDEQVNCREDNVTTGLIFDFMDDMHQNVYLTPQDAVAELDRIFESLNKRLIKIKQGYGINR